MSPPCSPLYRLLYDHYHSFQATYPSRFQAIVGLFRACIDPPAILTRLPENARKEKERETLRFENNQERPESPRPQQRKHHLPQTFTG